MLIFMNVVHVSMVTLDYKYSPFFLWDSNWASEMQARVKITPRKKGKTQWGERKIRSLSWSPHPVLLFSCGVIFMHTRILLALLSMAWGKMGTTHSLGWCRWSVLISPWFFMFWIVLSTGLMITSQHISVGETKCYPLNKDLLSG